MTITKNLSIVCPIPLGSLKICVFSKEEDMFSPAVISRSARPGHVADRECPPCEACGEVEI